ncbi:MAG: hypothetical protein L0211_25830 [Planctomycetaceae bacterium]|nr:hypothetical protein [Planctomycetaceae bacterium]
MPGTSKRAALALVVALWVRSAARAGDGFPAAMRPVPAQVVSVEIQNQEAPAETVPAPVKKSALPAHDDVQLIARALGRVQPQDPAAKAIDQGDALLQGAGTTRLWGVSVSAWEAPAFCHRPLYFEDENLERHGRSCGLFQPAASAVHFAGRTAVWPYLAGAFPPHECIYTLGRERPGSCASYRFYRPPVSACGAVYEAAAITGLSFVIP